jgi:predicted NAD-dependent protein-ADP-ribosyltransferase YbiA (DUF1768 family)
MAIWGRSMQGEGANRLGALLMEVRQAMWNPAEGGR